RRNSVLFPSIIQPPLSIAYLAAMIRDAHSVQVIDAAAEHLGFKSIFKRLDTFQPGLVGITTNISIAYIACELALRIKIHMRNVKIVLGGPWATCNAEFIIKHRIADYVVLGEGEFVFRDLVDRFEKEEGVDDLAGLVLRGPSGNLIQNHKRDFIQNLDVLPYPAWDLLPPSEKYFNHYRHRPLYPMIITRGCPYGCIHCTKDVHGYKIRKRSVENVIGEMKYLIEKFHVKEIIIVDDNFTFDVKYAESLFDAIHEANIKLYLMLPNGIRADTLSPRMLKKMRKAGVYGFAIGVESGVQSIVKRIGKKLDLDKVRYAAKISREHGMLLRAFFILGLPYDSLETMRQTVRFAKEIDPHIAYFFVATLFPGTEMYDIVKEMGRIQEKVPGVIDSEMSVDAGFYYKPVSKFAYGKLKPGDVMKAYKIAVREFYMRPRKILEIISEIKSKPELQWILQYFVVSLLNIFTRFSGSD
nr:radical SAM protein [Candidatus Sigynarchaeota archaeon]